MEPNIVIKGFHKQFVTKLVLYLCIYLMKQCIELSVRNHITNMRELKSDPVYKV